ncbi:Zinc metalloproteinase nas-39 [Holothuria leucospilota]|uniref:Zinc metalloproteinase nas-39 n=1 Tax=Holothuria leucospilota TaxID=206669 RepID=A0A9Q1BSB4_HOLLE|nr:Zinc metalloproteinase nas-39 [Holothuria leucospilota]
MVVKTCISFHFFFVKTETKVTLLNNASGEFSSPGYPNTTSGFFAWHIRVNEHHRIFLQFLDFQLHPHRLCRRDYVILYDGSSIDAPLIGRWCWKAFSEMINNTYNSSSKSFYLVFRGHPSFSRKGFNVTYFSCKYIPNIS